MIESINNNISCYVTAAAKNLYHEQAANCLHVADRIMQIMIKALNNNISMSVVSAATKLRNGQATNCLSLAGRVVTAEVIYLTIPIVGIIEYVFHFCIAIIVAPVDSQTACNFFENAGVSLFIGTTYAPKCAFTNFIRSKLTPPSVVV